MPTVPVGAARPVIEAAAMRPSSETRPAKLKTERPEAAAAARAFMPTEPVGAATALPAVAARAFTPTEPVGAATALPAIAARAFTPTAPLGAERLAAPADARATSPTVEDDVAAPGGRP